MSRRWQLVAVGAAVLAAGAGIARRDYNAWRSLGVGGLPPNLTGWIQVTRFRLRGRDPLRPLHPPDGPPSASLTALPHRMRPRPAVGSHPIPHRVLTRHAGPDEKAALKELFDGRIAQRPALLEYRTSRWERNNDALFLRDSPPDDGTEVGHIHPSDGSMHLTLRPADAATVVDRCWGEYHPLAGIALGLPETYMLIYPPQTTDELHEIDRIVTAAILHAAGSGDRARLAP